MTTTFDPAETSPNITLSNGNLTATKTSATNYYAIAWTPADNATKMYLEVRHTVTRTDSGFGIANGDSMPDDGSRWIGDGTNSIGLWATDIWHNGAVAASFSPGQAINDWIGVAVDTAAATIAFRNITQGGSWSTPLSISALGAGPFYFAATLTTNDNTTVNFDSAFLGAPPAGYTRWDGSAALIFYTLTANTGTLALTRNDAVLKRTIVMPAVKGTFALAGVVAALQRAVPLVAATRAFVLTGFAANLVAARRIIADKGTVALLGVDAGLRIARQVIADTGSFVLAGIAAGMAAARRIIAEQGLLALTGNDANLVKTAANRLIADAGAFLLTGQPAGLRCARALPAAAGAVTLTGNAVNLVYAPAAHVDYTLVAAPGTIVVSGYPVDLHVTRVPPPIVEMPPPGVLNMGRRVVLWHNRW